MKIIEDAIRRLDAIAKLNDDEFGYRINIESTRQAFHYSFECFEMTDGHDFACGCANTIEQAVALVLADIPVALASWDYIE